MATSSTSTAGGRGTSSGPTTPIPTAFCIDEIIHPDCRAQAEQFECPICLRIPSSPVYTKCCEQVFCIDCLGELTMCANCRSPFEPNQGRSFPMPKIVQRMLYSLRVVCPHGAKGDVVGARPVSGGKELQKSSEKARGEKESSRSPTTGSTALSSDAAVGGDTDTCDDAKVSGEGGGGTTTHGCEAEAAEPAGGSRSSSSGSAGAPETEHVNYCVWQGPYELLHKHLLTCTFANIKCPRGCGETVVRGKLAEHEAVCIKCVEICRICKAELRPGEVEEHKKAAAELHLQILEAKFDDDYDRVPHQMLMKGMIQALSMQMLTDGFGEAIWRVKTADLFAKCKAKADEYRSPPFRCGNLDQCQLVFQGYGGPTSKDTCAGLHIVHLNPKEYIDGSAIRVTLSAVDDSFVESHFDVDTNNLYECGLIDRKWGMANAVPITELKKVDEVIVSVTIRRKVSSAGRIVNINSQGDLQGGRVSAATTTRNDMKAETLALKQHVNTETAALKKQLASLQNTMMVVLVILVAVLAVALVRK